MSAPPAEPVTPEEIRAEGVTKRFGTLAAIQDLTLSIGRGEIFGLVGPDGAGKTTVMRMLAGVMRPSAGTIIVDGIDVVRAPERVKQRLSYMPQRFGLYEDLTVEENIRFYADLFGIARGLRDERSARLLAASGLTAFRRRLAGQLSGGMKQKLGLACALIHAPMLVLLDEPTTGVDPVSRRDFWRLLYGLQEDGVTIVIATAYLDEAERCHRLALLHGGQLLHCDTPAALKARMPGGLLILGTPEPRRARAALLGRAGIRSIVLTGDGLHLVVDDATRRLPEIAVHLRGGGIAVQEIAQSTPSIEDVLAALVDQAPEAA